MCLDLFNYYSYRQCLTSTPTPTPTATPTPTPTPTPNLTPTPTHTLSDHGDSAMSQALVNAGVAYSMESADRARSGSVGEGRDDPERAEEKAGERAGTGSPGFKLENSGAGLGGLGSAVLKRETNLMETFPNPNPSPFLKRANEIMETFR